MLLDLGDSCSHGLLSRGPSRRGFSSGVLQQWLLRQRWRGELQVLSPGPSSSSAASLARRRCAWPWDTLLAWPWDLWVRREGGFSSGSLQPWLRQLPGLRAGFCSSSLQPWCRQQPFRGELPVLSPGPSLWSFLFYRPFWPHL